MRLPGPAEGQYRCTLRSGLKFSNGHALTSEDVKFSLDRVLRIKDRNGPVSLLSNVDTVETPTSREVVIHLRAPDATFPSKLITPAAAILDSEVYQGNALRKGFDLVGSGPYQAKTEVRGDRLVKVLYTRNPNYQGDVKPDSNKVELRFFDSASAMEKALAKGDIDVVHRGFSPGQIDKLNKGEVKGVRLFESSGQGIRHLVFDTDDPSVRAKAVRQAIAHLVDRQALVRDVYKRTARAPLLADPEQRHLAHQLVLQQVRRPGPRCGPQRAAQRRDQHPGEADPDVHDRPLRSGDRAGVQGAPEPAQPQRPLQGQDQGRSLE